MNDTAQGNPADTPPGTKPPRSRWLDLGIAIAVLPLALAALRIVLFSGGDPVLMRVLIETLDVTTLLLGTVLPFLPLAFWLVLQPLLADTALARQLLNREAPNRIWWWILIIAMPVLYVLVGPWPGSLTTLGWVAGALVLGVMTAWVFFVIRARVSGSTWRDSLRIRLTWADRPAGHMGRLLVVPAVLFVVLFAVPKGFWLPLEAITADRIEVTGYVLQTEGGWTTIMTEDREVHRYLAATVTERAVCDQGDYESLATIIAGASLDLDVPCE